MKKYNLERLKEAMRDQFDVDPKGWDKEEIKALLCDSLDAEEFEERGYRFGDRSEAWEALATMAACIEKGAPVSPVVGMWFLNAMNHMAKEDPRELLRQLGLVEHGRSRVVNKFDICDRMIDLVDRQGVRKADASRACADEFDCSPSTALHWYNKRNEIFNN